MACHPPLAGRLVHDLGRHCRGTGPCHDRRSHRDRAVGCLSVRLDRDRGPHRREHGIDRCDAGTCPRDLFGRDVESTGGQRLSGDVLRCELATVGGRWRSIRFPTFDSSRFVGCGPRGQPGHERSTKSGPGRKPETVGGHLPSLLATSVFGAVGRTGAASTGAMASRVRNACRQVVRGARGARSP